MDTQPQLLARQTAQVLLKLCYMKPYEGLHRVVLVACQSTYDGDVNETFGHLPLDLFD